MAAVILKLETVIKNEGAKKDMAAILSVAAALMVTISTSGDFQRKWQANRVAAAEIERAGYEFLEKDGAQARSYLATVGQSLLRRHMAIVGGSEQRKPPQEPGRPRCIPRSRLVPIKGPPSATLRIHSPDHEQTLTGVYQRGLVACSAPF